MSNMTIKDLCEKSHAIALSKGFWGNCWNCKGTHKEVLSNNCAACSSSCIGTKAERNISELLMLVVSELGEAQEALRMNNRQSYKPQKYAGLVWYKDTFEDEICDAFIRLADLCEALKIDIEWQIKMKMKYNKNREYKHGKQF